MYRKAFSLVLMVLSLLVTTIVGRAQTTFEDPQGRFVIDLPKGWQLAPQTDDKVFVFQGEGKTIIIECVPMVNDPAEILKKAETTVRLSGMAKPALDGDITEMTLNGLPARWGIYKGAMAGVTLAALCGGIANGENGLYFLSFVSVTELAKWKDKLEKAFQSIRGQGQIATGVENVKTAGGVAVAPAATATPWASDLVSMSLPPGWTEKPKPRGFEKEVKGWFMNDNLPGASLMVVCYKGAGMTMAKSLEAGIKTVTIPVPNAKPVEAQEMKVEGKKIYFAVYTGTSVSAGTEVEMGAVIAVTKADKSYTNLIAIAMSSLIPELKSQVLEVVKTVK